MSKNSIKTDKTESQNTKEVVDGYNVLWTKDSEIYRDKPVSFKELYDAHLWFHHNGYDWMVKKNHTDLSEDKLLELKNRKTKEI